MTNKNHWIDVRKSEVSNTYSEASSTTKAKLRVRAIGLSRMWLNRKESMYRAETNLRQDE